MCGITLVARLGVRPQEEEVAQEIRIAEAQQRRGPGDGGHWVAPGRDVFAIPLASRSGYLLGRTATRANECVPAKLPAPFRDANTISGAYFARRGLFMPWELDEILDRGFICAGLREFAPLEWIGSALNRDPATGLGRVMALESSPHLRNQLLRGADWAGMDHPLELRTPLVDWRLWCALVPALGRREAPGKAPLVAAPSGSAPAYWANRPKTSLGLPLARWLSESEMQSGESRNAAARASRAIARNLTKAGGTPNCAKALEHGCG